MEIATNRNISIACVAGAGASLLAAFLFQSPLAAISSSMLFFLSLLIWKYGYIFMPWLTSSLGASIQGAGWRLVAGQDVLLTRSGGSHIASVFLGVRLYESSTDKDAAGRGLLMEYFERAVSSLRYPVKVCLLISPLDTSKIEDELRGRRSGAEVHRARALSSGKSHLADADRLKREIGAIDNVLSKISGGQRPMDLAAYIMASSSGVSEGEAVALAKARAGEIKAAFSNALGAEISILSGDELLRCASFERSVPASGESLAGEFGG